MIRHERLAAQGLLSSSASLVDVVARMGAIQAQDYYGCLWAVGVRAPSRERDVEKALDDGVILRTHSLRGTWQLTTPADLRMFLRLAHPRVTASADRRHKDLGLDAKTLKKALDAIEKDLASGGGDRTRAELAAVLERAKVSPEGQRLSHILIHAELHELITSGKRRGKQTTHALLDARAPTNTRVLVGKDANAEVARRYFTTRGPATLADFVWWSGLPVQAARDALDAVADLVSRGDIDGVAIWSAPEHANPRVQTGHALLLPPFDEYLVAYKDRNAVLHDDHVKKVNAGGGLLAPVVVVDGDVLGTWKRTLGKNITVDYSWFDKPPAKAVRAFIDAAEERWRAFLS